MKKNKLEAETYYSATAIVRMGLPGFPWRSVYTFIGKLKDPRWFSTFKPFVQKHAFNRTYMVQGKNITRFLADLERGRIKTWQK